MIIKVRKYLIFGVNEDLDVFYAKAQKSGFIEFISDRKPSGHLPDSIRVFVSALKIMKSLPVASKKLLFESSEEAFQTASHVVELHGKIEKGYEEKRVLSVEKARIAPFGDFSPDDLDYIRTKGRLNIQFFSAKAGKGDELLASSPDLVRVAREGDLDYFISLNPTLKMHEALTEMRIEKPLGVILSELDAASNSLHRMERELKELASYREALNEELIARLNEYHLDSAKEEATMPLSSESVFSAEAWIPDSKVGGMFELLEGLAVHCERIGIEEEDRPPTVMENTGSARLGEDLVRFYDAPSITDKDPSGFVFWFFALFFAIIIADGGYGLIFLALAGYLKWKWKTFYGASKRLFRLFVILSLFVVGWGVATGSFFGVELSSNNLLKKIAPFSRLVEAKASYHLQQKDDVYQEYVHLSPAARGAAEGGQFLKESPAARKDFADDILLDITLIIGIVHISIGMLRYARRNLAGIGWVCFLFGAYFYFPTALNATTIANFLGLIDKATGEIVGRYMVWTGFSVAVLLALIQKKWKGILEVMNVIQVSADVLSYLRLYALALASSIMAGTFNDIGETVGLIGGFFIVLAGHLSNISLGTMSGVIHGLRLNFIEWYRYSFEGGGRLFNPLRILRSKEE